MGAPSNELGNELAFILASWPGFGEPAARWDTQSMSEERARRYHRLQLGLSVVAFALSVGYLFALLATGASARLAARLAEWTARPWLPVAAMALAGGAGWGNLPS